MVYRLLSRRIERDLLLISTLLVPPPLAATRLPTKGKEKDTSDPSTGDRALEPTLDSRTYPALVKLLDTVLQSLEQMRTLSIVEESADLVSAIEARLSFSKARR